MSMGVPFTDLTTMTSDIRPAVDRAWMDLLNSSRFVGGDAVAEFEQAWASYCGISEAVGAGNGTDGLLLMLMALGIGVGDLLTLLKTIPVVLITRGAL
jgi:dTDP-4-amino-4,6-dideoxygalactose transaminase